jgi:tetratricopeptide (TPR) repeat protein
MKNPLPGGNVRRAVAVAGLLAIPLLTVVAYAPALRAGFVWDDDAHVVNEESLRGLRGLARIWLKPGATCQYYPVTFTGFWIQYRLWGLNPKGYHAVNVALHAANALLLWMLLLRLGFRGAWAAAAIFALHPLHAMSVAWITELKNVLSLFLGLIASLLFFALPVDFRGGRSRLLLGLSLAFFSLALLAKTAVASLPLGWLLALWWKRDIEYRDGIRLLPFFVLAVAAGLATVLFEQMSVFAPKERLTLRLGERVVLAGHAFWFYLGKFLWPRGLSFTYPRWSTTLADWRNLAWVAATIAALAGAWSLRQRLGRGPFAALAFFFVAGPAIVLIHTLYMMQYTPVANHWAYVAGIAIIAPAVHLAARFSGRIGRAAGIVPATLALAALIPLTFGATRTYANVETLWRETLSRNPGCILSLNNLGLICTENGRAVEAIGLFRRAIESDPSFGKLHHNLGNALVRVGNLEDGLKAYRRAIEIRPDYVAAHRSLATALIRARRFAEAADALRAALRYAPGDVAFHNDLGACLIQSGRFQEAEAPLSEALRLDPQSEITRRNLQAVRSALLRGAGMNQGAPR